MSEKDQRIAEPLYRASLRPSMKLLPTIEIPKRGGYKRKEKELNKAFLVNQLTEWSLDQHDNKLSKAALKITYDNMLARDLLAMYKDNQKTIGQKLTK